MYCRNCAAEVGSEQRHCRKCGAKQPVGGDVSGTPASGGDAVAVTTGVLTSLFVGLCLLLMFIFALKMMADDKYILSFLVVLGAGSLIYGSLWWQKKQAAHLRKSERDTGKQIDSEDEKLLASSDQQFSVTEETTRKLEPSKLRGKH